MNQLSVKLLSSTAKAPAKPRAGDAGYDLFAAEGAVLEPGDRATISLGIATFFPPWYVGLIRDRSSMAARGLFVTGGVIDASYRGEWSVILNSLNTVTYVVRPGDKIAQVLFVPITSTMPVVTVGDLPESFRGAAGFGSTGS